jgi:GNAT superfamily N-acetyltransferase
MEFHIDYACDAPALHTDFAAAQMTAFAPMIADMRLDATLLRVRAHVQRGALPTSFIAHDGAAFLGGCSLLASTSADTRPWTPWLASLVVRADRRGRGIGTALVQRCVDEARALGLPELHLYCAPELHDYYATRGWQRCGDFTRGTWQATVMRIGLQAARADAA